MVKSRWRRKMAKSRRGKEKKEEEEKHKEMEEEEDHEQRAINHSVAVSDLKLLAPSSSSMSTKHQVPNNTKKE